MHNHSLHYTLQITKCSKRLKLAKVVTIETKLNKFAASLCTQPRGEILCQAKNSMITWLCFSHFFKYKRIKRMARRKRVSQDLMCYIWTSLRTVCSSQQVHMFGTSVMNMRGIGHPLSRCLWIFPSWFHTNLIWSLKPSTIDISAAKCMHLVNLFKCNHWLNWPVQILNVPFSVQYICLYACCMYHCRPDTLCKIWSHV